MRLAFIYIAFIFAFALVTPLSDAQAETQTQFFVSIQDMPLMPGLIELPDQTVMFDKPEGRIIESVAEIESGAGHVTHYYESTLPQLGWSRLAENVFVRQGERLQLSFERIEDREFLRIMIAPK